MLVIINEYFKHYTDIQIYIIITQHTHVHMYRHAQTYIHRHTYTHRHTYIH